MRRWQGASGTRVTSLPSSCARSTGMEAIISGLVFSWNETTSVKIVLTTLVLVLLIWQMWSYVSGVMRYPRGPTPFPVIGNVFHLLWQQDMIEFLMKAWQHYGDVFSIKIGSKMFVVLNGYSTIYEALIKRAESFSEHNYFHTLSNESVEDAGIIFAEYPVWKKHRKLLLRVFKDMGFVKQSLQDKVNEEISKVMPILEDTHQQPFSIEDVLQRAVSNVISSVVFGNRFDYEDEDFNALISINKKLIERGRKLAIVQLFPFLLYLPFDPLKVRDTLTIGNHLINLIKKKITDHQKNNEHSQASLLQSYILEIEKSKEAKNGYFTERRCVTTVAEVFGAGTETTSTALCWSFLFCVMHPEMQQRIYTEIERNVGQRVILLSDRQAMPYVNAFLTEVLRFANVVPLAIPHRVIHDVNFNGNFIPEGTEIIINLHSVLHDDKIYNEPHQFRPERFLDFEGNFLLPEKMTPFGMGRRSCIGEELARTELFLFFTATVQRFLLKAAPGSRLSTKASLGLTRSPLPYKIVAVPRRCSSTSNLYLQPSSS